MRFAVAGAVLRAAVLFLALALAGLVGCEDQKQAIQQDLPAARAQKARGDAQAIVSAVKLYAATVGVLPESLEQLTTATTANGVTSGPFLARVPTPPPGWSAWRYERRDDGTFQVSITGEGQSISLP